MFILEPYNPKVILIHLHGFASNTQSSKIKIMQDILKDKASFFAMDMDYHRTTTTKTLELLDTLIKGFKTKGFSRIILSGSSHGAYVILNYLRFYREDITAALLFAPSYSTLSLTLQEQGQQNCKNWLEGKEELHIYECETGLDFYINKDFAVDIIEKGYEIIRDGEVLFDKTPSLPIYVCHGTQDKVVPVEHSRLFVSNVKVKEYVEVDDDHRLSKSFEAIFKRFLEIL